MNSNLKKFMGDKHEVESCIGEARRLITDAMVKLRGLPNADLDRDEMAQVGGWFGVLSCAELLLESLENEGLTVERRRRPVVHIRQDRQI